MGQEPESDKNASGIAHAPKRKWGYDSVQVDAFLERAHKLYEGEGIQLTQNDIQKVSFDLVKGGYVIAQVDAALARLERAVVDKQTTWEISQHGRVAWKGQTEALFRELNDHAQREEGERFKPGEPKKPSYDRKQVDRIIDQCLMKAADSLDITKMGDDDAKKLADLNSRTVANVIFTQRKGKRGYDERQVDYYLASCVQLLTRLESYDRVADFVGDPASAATAGDDASETELLTPVYAAPVSVDSQVIAESQSAIHSNESFDFLNKEEHAIFKAPAASPVTTPVAPQGTQSAPLPAVGMAGGNAASQPAAAQPAVAQPAKTSIFAPGGISAPTASAAAVESTVGTETEPFNPVADAPAGFAPATGAAAVPPVAAPSAAPVQPTSVPTASPSAASSLAALAQQTISSVSGTSGTSGVSGNTVSGVAPQVPDLSAPSVPQLNTGSLNLGTAVPSPQSASAAVPASTPSAATSTPVAPYTIPASTVTPAPSFAPTASTTPAPAVTTPAASSLPSFAPAVPTTAIPSTTPALGADGDKDAKKPAAKPLFPSTSGDPNLDIPDLSFPSFD